MIEQAEAARKRNRRAPNGSQHDKLTLGDAIDPVAGAISVFDMKVFFEGGLTSSPSGQFFRLY